MTLLETINLIKNFEEQIKNYTLYMEKINITLKSNIAYVNEIKLQIEFDSRLKNRLITLGNAYMGTVIQHFFPELFVDENKKVR